jgi:invasion protein IalB
VLKVKLRSTDQKDLTLSVSLKGLAPALDRLKALAGV